MRGTGEHVALSLPLNLKPYGHGFKSLRGRFGSPGASTHETAFSDICQMPPLYDTRLSTRHGQSDHTGPHRVLGAKPCTHARADPTTSGEARGRTHTVHNQSHASGAARRLSPPLPSHTPRGAPNTALTRRTTAMAPAATCRPPGTVPSQAALRCSVPLACLPSVSRPVDHLVDHTPLSCSDSLVSPTKCPAWRA